MDIVQARRELVVVAEVVAAVHEVADPVVGDARLHRLVGKLGEVVVEAEEEAPDVRHGRRRRRLRRRAGNRRRLGDARQRVMRVDLNRYELRRCPRLQDSGIARVEGISLAEGALERAVGAGDVGEQQHIGFDQNRLAIRVRLAHNRRRGEQAVGKRFAHRARLRRIRLREVIRVAREQLHLVHPEAMEIDDMAFAHQPAEEEFLPETA